MVNIREYYEKDGQELPGKKVRFYDQRAHCLKPYWLKLQGISLPVDQFTCLLNILPEIETALGEHGESVPRPEYDAIKSNPGEGDEQQGESEDNTNNPPDSKKNIEMTSEEDESEE